MEWFDETKPMGWLVAFWIASALLLLVGSWVLTRHRTVRPSAPLPPTKVIDIGSRSAPP